MAEDDATLQQALGGTEDPGRIATALVEWMVDADLGEDLIDQERSRRDPTIDERIADRLPKSLVHELTKGPGDGWAIGTPPATESPLPRVADDGTVRAWFPARSEWEVRHDSVGTMPLEDVLHWIRLYSPAARRFEFDPDDGPKTPESALALHESVNHRTDQIVFVWFVGDSAVLFVHAGGYGAPAIEVLGRRRAEVERVDLPQAVWSEWKSVEYAMEVETDNWTAPDHAFPGVTGAVAGRDLLAEVASAPPVTAFDNFILVWFGAEPSKSAAGSRPVAIETALAARLELYRDAHLEDPTAEHRFDGPPNSFLAECQFLWQAGYHDGADPDPQVILRIDQEPQREDPRHPRRRPSAVGIARLAPVRSARSGGHRRELRWTPAAPHVVVPGRSAHPIPRGGADRRTDEKHVGGLPLRAVK